VGKSKSKKSKKRPCLNLITIFFFCVMFYMLYTIYGQTQYLASINSEKEQILIQKEVLEQDLASLEENLEKINNPELFLEMVERIARDEYKMVKPYETIYIDKNKTTNKFITGIGSGP
jgi:cell division protein DivIC